MIKYFYVYILQSKIDKNFFVGLTTNLLKRIEEHSKGKVISTKTRLPMQLVYWEGCLNQSDAAQREKYLKAEWGKRYIKNYLTG